MGAAPLAAANYQPPAVFGNPRSDCPWRLLGIGKANAVVVNRDPDQVVGVVDVNRRAGRPAMLPGISHTFENDQKNLLEYQRAGCEIYRHFEKCLDREWKILVLGDLLDFRK